MKNRLVLGAALTATLLLSACAAEKTGPAPKVEALTPSLVCAEQLTTQIAIAGADLSPLAVDAAKENPLLEVPALSVRRTQDLAGNPVEGEAVVIPNDPAAPDAARVTWLSATAMTIEIYPELALEPGLYEITATNKNGQTVTLAGALTAVPRPTVEAAEPDLVCLEQGLRQVTVRGSGFLKVGAELPKVAIGALTLAVDSLESCSALPGPLTAESCLVAKLTVPEDALPAGAFAVTLTNPAPAACASTDEIPFAVVPAPTIEQAEPDLLCLAQGERQVTVTGTGFVVVGSELPLVAFAEGKELTPTAAEDCAAVAGTRLDAQSCTTLRLTVPEAWLEAGVFSLTVTNPDPAGCHTEETVTMAIVPPPSVASLDPDLTCLAEDQRAFTLKGAGLVVLRGESDEFPVVQIGAASFTPTAARGCAAIPGTLLPAESCTELDLALPTNGVPVGAAAVVVTNPLPAGCASTESLTLAVVPEPVLTAVEPDLLCSDQASALTLTGTGFVKSAGSLPTVVFGTGAAAVEVAADSATGCAAIEGTLSGAESCTGLAVEVPAAALPAGATAVAVRNPTPAGCTSNEALTVAVVGRPAIAAVEPGAVCAVLQPETMNVVGSGFLFGAAAAPVLTVDGTAVAILAHSGCVPVLGGGAGFELCTTLSFAVPAGGYANGVHTVSITNPEPADCAAGATGEFNVTDAPVLTSISPLKVCRTGGSITAEGTGFVSTSTIVATLDGAVSDLATTFVDTEHLTGEVTGLAAGTYDVTVSNGIGCEDTLAAALRVVDQPFVFFVDPPVVYNGINLQVTVYASGISDTVLSIGIRPAGTTVAPTELTFSYDPTRANRILVDVPAGLAAGEYDLLLVDSTCSAEFPSGLRVTDSLSVSVASIDPPFGWDEARTAVDITSDPSSALANFVATPRAYLNPQTPGGFATELRAVAFLDELRLSGIVPSGLAVDTYDLIVINPDGGVGLLSSAYTVVDDPPPEVSALSPASVASQSGTVVGVIGENFRAGAVAEASCVTPADVTVVPPGATTFVDGNNLSVVWDMSTVTSGSVCIVRVANSDGTYTDFSALMVTTPSGNPNPFELSQPMLTGRRALGAAAVRMNGLERYLFAIGGEDGAATNATFASVEAARVDALGRVEAWAPQLNALPAPRSYTTAAAVGRFVYLPGGRLDDGVSPAAPTADVLRAYLLDPFEAPEFLDLDVRINYDLPSGLGAGTWYYRVAAVLDGTDPNNPNGEALASEPLVLRLPSGTRALQLTLYWSSIPNAASYRIYRSPTADLTSGSERLLVEIPAVAGIQSFTDDGSGTVGTEAPVPVGSLGTWHSVGSLSTAREGAGVVAVPHPTDPTIDFLYVMGGRDAAGALLDGIELATVTTTDTNAQAIAAFGPSGATLPSARWLLGAVYVDGGRAVSLQSTTDVYVYALPGSAGTNMATRVAETDGFQVNLADGTLGAAVSVASPNKAGGYGYAAGSNYVYLFGGGGGVSDTSFSGEILTAPTLANWNNTGQGRLLVGRFLHASATESGFVFLLGGQTGTETATTSTESTNF